MQPATASHFIPTRILVPLDFSSSSDAALGRHPTSPSTFTLSSTC